HAHADWPTYSGGDFNRPLTPRGKEDAAAAALAIRDAGLSPSLVLTSPAQRALQTAQILAATLNLPAARLRFVDALYNASADELDAQLRQAVAPGAITMLIAHNPGISDLARHLANDASRPPFAPAGWASFTYAAT
ncbi:MAG: histidine phosphatase family protein, partial [Nevskiaceae bacterium]|nr:histidine phosphatase family protein [Nevskiaceae bacterium]